MPKKSGRGRRSQTVQDRRSSSKPETEPTPGPAPIQYDDKDRALLNFILLQSSSKTPIKFSDLLSVVGGNQKNLKERIEIVKTLLEDRYGIKSSIVQAGGKKLICYAESHLFSMHEMTSEQRPLCTLLYILLTFIFMRNNNLEEEKLYQFLESLNIDKYEPHDYFGDVKRHIEETLCKQLYLKREREQPGGFQEPKILYSWGARAVLEFTYEQIAQCTAKLFNEDSKYFNYYVQLARGLVNKDSSQRRDTDSDTSMDLDADSS